MCCGWVGPRWCITDSATVNKVAADSAYRVRAARASAFISPGACWSGRSLGFLSWVLHRGVEALGALACLPTLSAGAPCSTPTPTYCCGRPQERLVRHPPPLPPPREHFLNSTAQGPGARAGPPASLKSRGTWGLRGQRHTVVGENLSGRLESSTEELSAGRGQHRRCWWGACRRMGRGPGENSHSGLSTSAPGPFPPPAPTSSAQAAHRLGGRTAEPSAALQGTRLAACHPLNHRARGDELSANLQGGPGRARLQQQRGVGELSSPGAWSPDPVSRTVVASARRLITGLERLPPDLRLWQRKSRSQPRFSSLHGISWPFPGEDPALQREERTCPRAHSKRSGLCPGLPAWSATAGRFPLEPPGQRRTVASPGSKANRQGNDHLGPAPQHPPAQCCL